MTDHAGEPFLVEGSSRVATPGQATALVPPDEDIHRVSNCGNGIAIAIHVYGADIGALSTSVNRCFDSLPLRGEADRVGYARLTLP